MASLKEIVNALKRLNIKSKASPDKEDYIKAILNWSFFTTIYLGIVLMADQLNHIVSLILLGFSLVIIMLYVLIIEFTSFRSSIPRYIFKYKAWGAIALIFWIGLLTTVFGLFCREFNYVFGGGFSIPENASISAWIGFGFDNLFEAVFFDLMNVYHISLSNITQTSLITQTFVMVFRLFIDLMILRFIFSYIKRIRNYGKNVLKIAPDARVHSFVDE